MNRSKIIKVLINNNKFTATYENNDIKKRINDNTYNIGDYIAYVKNNKVCCGDIYSICHPNTKESDKIIFNNKSKIEFMVNNKLKEEAYSVNPLKEKIIKISPKFYNEFINILKELNF